MSAHFNIQISIQQLTEPEPMTDKGGYPVKSIGGVQMTERKVIKVLDLAISASSERDAYAKAHSMLAAAQPPWAEPQHLHRASCDDSIGMKVCGYPADGPTIIG